MLKCCKYSNFFVETIGLIIVRVTTFPACFNYNRRISPPVANQLINSVNLGRKCASHQLILKSQKPFLVLALRRLTEAKTTAVTSRIYLCNEQMAAHYFSKNWRYDRTPQPWRSSTSSSSQLSMSSSNNARGHLRTLSQNKSSFMVAMCW